MKEEELAERAKKLDGRELALNKVENMSREMMGKVVGATGSREALESDRAFLLDLRSQVTGEGDR